MGLRDISPATRILANSADITATIDSRFKALRIVDESGLQADTLEIELADHDPAMPIQRPAKGAELEVYLGYDNAAQRMGLFVVDEIEYGGWPGYMVIRARAAVYEQTPKGKKDLQTQKTRSWAKATTIQAMVAKIAQEHGMEPAVSKSLASVQLPHLDQTEESDISFLLRVLKTYDATVKPSGGKLVVVKRGEGTSASGQALPGVTMTPLDVGPWTCRESARESRGTVVAYWHSTIQGKRQEVTVGSGDPVKRLRHSYPTQEAAKAAAQGELDKRARKERQFQATMEGRPTLAAEVRLTLQGFRDGVAGDWILKRVEHVLDENGYRTNVQAEQPKDAEPV